MTLTLSSPLSPLSPGDRLNDYQLQVRIDSLGTEKLYARERDHSYFGISPPPSSSSSAAAAGSSLSHSLLDSLSQRERENEEREKERERERVTERERPFLIDMKMKRNEIEEKQQIVKREEVGGEEEEERDREERYEQEGNENDLTTLNEVHIESNDESVKGGNFYLNRKIFFGGHGEIWLAKQVFENGNIDMNTSYVLKRMHLKDRPEILRCALREIYFGDRLQSNPRVARYVSHFVLKDDYWLVFRDEGISLQGLLYALTVDKGLPALEPSAIWYRMRTTLRGEESMKSILFQILTGVSSLHHLGIIHRDLKPSNILINAQSNAKTIRLLIADFSSAIDDEVEALGLYGEQGPTVDEESEQYRPPESLFSCIDSDLREGECHPLPYDKVHPESYDSWSIGVLFAEMILGTANIFSVDQRTSALITHRMRRASKERVDEALKLAAMAEMCIYHPSSPKEPNDGGSLSVVNPSIEKTFEVSRKYLNPTVQASSCDLVGISEFQRALQRRDPLGTGYHNKEGLDLLFRFLKWNPEERISVREALTHAYFVGPYVSVMDESDHMTRREMEAYDNDYFVHETVSDDEIGLTHDNEIIDLSSDLTRPQFQTPSGDEDLESFSKQLHSFLNITPPSSNSTHLYRFIPHTDQLSDVDLIEIENSPRVTSESLLTFTCPKCGRSFHGSWESCHAHILTRKHGSTCTYDQSLLPSCLSSHSLLPIDPHSGWCDLQGRRKYIEDAHAVVFTTEYKFFGVFDGHWGNRAANYASRHIQSLFDERIRSHSGKIGGVSNSSVPRNASQLWVSLYSIPESDLGSFILHNKNINLTIMDALEFIRQAFIQTNEDFLRTLSGESGDSRSGSTATVSILFDNFLIIGNIGDSRAVLCCDKDGLALQLTIDHTPYESIESDRIINAGGFIDTSGLHRVNKLLAVTRSIGDRELRHVLTSEPDLFVFRRFVDIDRLPSTFQTNNHLCSIFFLKRMPNPEFKNPIPQQFLVLGSDGLWDVMSNQEVVNFICESLTLKISNSGDLPIDAFQTVARELGREAYVRGSSDNIGVCIIDLFAHPT